MAKFREVLRKAGDLLTGRVESMEDWLAMRADSLEP